MKSWKKLIALSVALCLCVGCRDDQDDTAQPDFTATGLPQVCTTNYPLRYFAEQIAGGLVEVDFPMKESGDPAFWRPDGPSIVKFQNADLILANGATHEKWFISVTLPEQRIVDTSAGFEDQFIRVENAVVHAHGPSGEHSHAGTAFTTWLDFDQAQQQASAIHDAMAKLVPDKAGELKTNFRSLADNLAQLDRDMFDTAKLIGDGPLMASHPIYDYLARRYSLNIKAVTWEPETVPDDNAMAELQEILKTHPAALMIWEGTPAAESVDKLKAIGIESIVFDPCANVDESADWLAVMRANLGSLRGWAESLE